MNGLSAFFKPASIAVAGASREPEKIGHVIYKQLKQNKEKGLLAADIYPVNPYVNQIDGDKVFKGFGEIGKPVDLVVVAVPASFVPDVVKDAAENGAKAAVVVSGGFSETGNDRLENALRQIVQTSNLRILGPNTVGIMDFYTGVDTFFIREFKTSLNGGSLKNMAYPKPGAVALVSQSGALATYFIDAFAERNGGIRAVACVGNQVDVKAEELVSFFVEDELTKVLAVYVEGVADGRSLLNHVLKARKLGKQVVVLKAGRSKTTEKAAYTHTASMVGEWDVFVGAFRQAGAVVVESVKELVDVAYAASLTNFPQGRRLLVLTNAGGFSVSSSDLAELNGLELLQFPEDVIEGLVSLRSSGKIPPIVVPNNPLDLSGSATPEAFEASYGLLSGLGDIHLLMPLHTPPAMNESVVEKLVKKAKAVHKTVLVCCPGSSEYAALFRRLFSENDVPVFRDLEDALRVAGLLAKTITPQRDSFPHVRSAAAGSAKPMSRSALISLLRENCLEPVDEIIVFRESEALKAAREIGFPVVMKLASEKVAHKSDVGGVVLNLSGESQVVEAFRRLMNLAAKLGVEGDGLVVQETFKGLELIVGGKNDRVFGPVVTVGLGGFFTEALRDTVSLVAPAEPHEVKTMLQYLKHKQLLYGFRNIPPADIDTIAKAVTNFSNIIIKNPNITTIEINPLTISHKKAKAVDFRAT
ncbi:MAG: acetate--CoA ligase family protein [Candidatus Caldarchaeum sp.]|nr:acetate--CoA ligase family protein [Candidatus Caldarchaeum sp.]